MPRRAHIIISAALVACGNSVSPPSASPSSAAGAPNTGALVAPPALSPAPSAVASPSNSAPVAIAELVAKTLPLPGATGPVTLDYIAYDRPHARVWVPVGDTGSADA